MISLALLIGGRGRRLGGVEKAQLRVPIAENREPIAELITTTFSPFVSTSFAVGRPDQHSHLPLVTDTHPDEGPLRGIATALRHASTPWVFVVATDLVGLVPSDLTALASERTRARLVIAWHGEPLCALYHRAMASIAEHHLERGERRAQALLAGAHLLRRASAILNVNTPEDLRALGIS